jgi:hypothetical protein
VAPVLIVPVSMTASDTSSTIVGRGLAGRVINRVVLW